MINIKDAVRPRKDTWDETITGTGHSYQPTEATKLRRLVEIQKQEEEDQVRSI